MITILVYIGARKIYCVMALSAESFVQSKYALEAGIELYV